MMVQKSNSLAETARQLTERAERDIFKKCIVDSSSEFWLDAAKTKAICEAVILEAMQVALELALIAIETCGKDCELAKGDFCHSADNIAIKRLKSSLAGVGKEA